MKNSQRSCGRCFNAIFIGKSAYCRVFNHHINHDEKDIYYMEKHCSAIVSRKIFLAVVAVISQRGKEKGVTKGSKYQSRYPFSGRIICSECGGTFKRRIHYSTHQKYIAWCCSRHTEKKEDCSMQFIRNDAVEAAFATMMNKLVYGHRKILRPLLDSLRRVDDDDSYHRVNELEDKIEAVMERGQVLAGLMTKGIWSRFCSIRKRMNWRWNWNICRGRKISL